MNYDLPRKSRPVVVVPYSPEWPESFRRQAAALRGVLGSHALRIDHIGSTAVPGLAAKDIIDVQVTVNDLDDGAGWLAALGSAGYQPKGGLQSDHLPPWFSGDPRQWEKRYVREPAEQQRTHIHVRAAGRENQRFALLFRDFLRAKPRFTAVYALVKHRLSELFPESIDTYLYIKDPVVDVIVAAAEEWAASGHWRPGPSDA